MIITEEWKNDVLIVYLEGSLDTLTSGSLESFLKDRMDSARQIIFDFTGVSYISSAGLRVIVMAHKRMKERDGLLIRNVGERVMEVFTVTGYVHALKIESGCPVPPIPGNKL